MLHAADCWACANRACSCLLSRVRSTGHWSSTSRKTSTAQLAPSPSNWTIALLTDTRPFKTAVAPTTPSWPVMAASTVSPEASGTTIDTTALKGKYTVLIVVYLVQDVVL